MAFQTGTRINPQLGALDFSGFTNAASIQAAALQDLGNRIGDAIGKSKEKKQKKAIISSISGAIKNQPEIAQALGFAPMTLEAEDVYVAATTGFDTFGLKGSQALLSEIFTSALKGDDDDDFLPKTIENFKDFVSMSDDYEIDDGQLINRRTNKVIGIDSKDGILNMIGAKEFIKNLSVDPLALQ